MRPPGVERDAQRFVRPQQMRLPDHIGQRTGPQAFGQRHIGPMGRIGGEQVVAHGQQEKNTGGSNAHYTMRRPWPAGLPCARRRASRPYIFTTSTP
ncbi:Uncharacterised protein [Bordetella pertussis]|nr:Uncharacterised protein [Bordetella pertussis]